MFVVFRNLIGNTPPLTLLTIKRLPPLTLFTIKRQPHGIERSLSPSWKLEIYRKMIITLTEKIKF